MRARVAALAIIGAALILGIVLLAASFVPSGSLATRLFGAAGEARSGAFSQELMAHLSDRLRLGTGLVLVLAFGLTTVRHALASMLCCAARDLASPRAWPDARTLVLPAVATLVGIGLRVPFLDQPMRYDEALTFNEFASRPLYYGLSYYPDPNNHLLNTLLMHLAFIGLGNQPWILRLPALLGGVLLVPATYWLAAEVYGEATAFPSAVLVATSSYLVEYSTNGRGYTLQALCFVALVTLLVRAVRRRSSSALAGAALVAALGAYAVPTMAYGVLVAAMWLLVELRRARERVFSLHELATGGLLFGLLVVLLYLPVLIVSGPENLAGNRFVVPLDAAELRDQLPRSVASTWTLWNRDVPLLLAVLLWLGVGLALAADLRAGRLPFAIGAAGVCLAAVLAQRVAPFERVWLFLLPVYLLTAAAGLARWVDGRLVGIVFGAVLGTITLTSGSILRSTETGVFPDAEVVARTLGPRLAPDDAVLTTLPASLPELQYYFPRYGLPVAVLVREPNDAQNLWLVAAPGAPLPKFDGFADPEEVARFAVSVLTELRRPSG